MATSLAEGPRISLRNSSLLLVFEVVWLVSFIGICLRSEPRIPTLRTPRNRWRLLCSLRSFARVRFPRRIRGLPVRSINYYYFGYQSVATLVHLSGVDPSMAFNLTLGKPLCIDGDGRGGPWGYGLPIEHAESGDRIWASAGVSAFFVALAGNLETFTGACAHPGNTVSAGWWDGVGWQASRVMSTVESTAIRRSWKRSTSSPRSHSCWAIFILI